MGITLSKSQTQTPSLLSPCHQGSGLPVVRLRVVGKEILLPGSECALDAVKTPSQEELMQLKVLNTADCPGFGKLFGAGS